MPSNLLQPFLDQQGFVMLDGGLATELEVDGGVKLDNIREVVAAGADVLVAGSAVFNTDDYAATITALRESAVSIET